MAQIQITLSRAHKVAERLKAKAAEKAAEAERLSSSVSVSGTAGPGQIERMASQGAKAMECAAASERLMRAAASVRAAIGRENESRGIGALLAMLDAVNRATAAKKAMLERARDGAIAVHELALYKPLQEEGGYGSGAVRVNMFTDDQRAALEAEAAKLQREAFSLSDQVAEANGARFALALDDDLVAEATGA